MAASDAIGDLLAALSYGERAALRRAEANADLAPDERTRKQQEHVVARERENAALLEARAREVGRTDREGTFAPFFDAFFEDTEPRDWLEAQAWHYVGDALVGDFGDVLLPALDRVSAEVVRRALLDREEQEGYALDELTRLLEDDPRRRDGWPRTPGGSSGRASPRPAGRWWPREPSGACSAERKGRSG